MLEDIWVHTRLSWGEGPLELVPRRAWVPSRLSSTGNLPTAQRVFVDEEALPSDWRLGTPSGVHFTHPLMWCLIPNSPFSCFVQSPPGFSLVGKGRQQRFQSTGRLRVAPSVLRLGLSQELSLSPCSLVVVVMGGT